MTNNIGILLLAAGQSRRFGSNKMLANINGKPLLGWSLDVLGNIGGDLLVVLGPEKPELVTLCAAHHYVICQNAADGIGHSIAYGVKRLLASKKEYQGIMVALADQVAISPDNYGDLIRRFQQGHAIAAASYNNVIGAPVIFDRRYASELVALTGDQGAQALLKKYANKVVTVDIPSGALDIDTRENLRAYLKNH